MVPAGIIGGRVGYHVLRRIAPIPREYSDRDVAYAEQSKLEALFGPSIWRSVEGRVVIDFGCGRGEDALEMARHGARRVIGIDVLERYLASARQAASLAGLSDRCVFGRDTDERADVIVSIDGFEHYGDPDLVLRVMRRVINADGRVLIAFGPPWLHPLGGHLFSVFPWAHLIFTERALMRWRADFKDDGATRFAETDGGLNGMTIRRFRKLVQQSEFTVDAFETVPIRRLARLSNLLTREFVTSVVKCRLIPGSPEVSTEASSCAA